MKNYILALWVVFLLDTPVAAQAGLILSNYRVLEEKIGDLDKDGIPEKVVVYNTSDRDPRENEVTRELIIYKKIGTKWKIWQRSSTAVLNSREGGAMGDPFEGIEIKNNVLTVIHYGGAGWKWGTIDKYRFQHGQFELIGYENNGGRVCEYWENLDFNISTGKIVYKKEYERCSDKNDNTVFRTDTETFVFKLKTPITLQNRNGQKIKIVSPKYRVEYTL